ncbi:MAG: ABC transporter substrate-binding protein [Betaproteobacteria bacterium]|nr:ABC transporter substrate-binding protein [Betaproteobacteria bacterium]
MTHRRTFLAAATLSLLTTAHGVRAQPAGRVFRLGLLRPSSPAPTEFSATGIPNALRQLGLVSGQNLVLETRYAGGHIDRLPGLARELVQLHCDAIIAVGTSAVRAARAATSTIPIVMFGNFDPVAAGLVDSLARPGGNVTGVLIAPDGTLAAKKLELLGQAVPRATRMAFLAPDDAGFRPQLEETRKAAIALGIELAVVTVRGGDYDRAFAAIAAERAEALFVGATTFFMTDRKPIIELAQRHRLPAIWEWPEQVRDGGLMAYGTSLLGLYQRVAVYVDRIFKGARPGDLPVEQPTKFDLVINLNTAKALRLNIPQSLLLRADEVIQ